MSRILAIGDVHGCCKALSALIESARIESGDTVVMLGDYVGKGPDSRGVIDLLLQLRSRCQLITLLGNHDRMMLAAIDGDLRFETWMAMGGKTALRSYHTARRLSGIPTSHLEFLRSCRLFHETEDYLFTHAGYDPKLPLSETDESFLVWQKIRNQLPDPHYSGKVAVVGHTSQKCGNVFDAGHLICIDTNCCRGGWLTMMELPSRIIRQANVRGELRANTFLPQKPLEDYGIRRAVS